MKTNLTRFPFFIFKPVAPAFVMTSALFALLTSTVALGYTVPETPPSVWNKGSFGVQTQSEYFFSHANYGENRGSFDTLVNGNKWDSFENRIKLRYGFLNWVSLYGGIGASAVDATNFSITRTNSAVNEVYAGVDFLLARRWWRVVPEFEASYPTDATQKFATNPLTSDGTPYANLGIFMFKPYRYLRFESYLGFHVPGDDLSKKFMYSLGAEIAVFGAFSIGGAVQGYESIISDGDTNADRKLTQATADATSARFWSWNPALLEARGWIGLRFDRSFGIRLGYAKTLNGVREAEGQSVLLSLYYNTAGQGGVRRGSPQVQVGPIPVAPSRDARDFRTNPEPNDPELFEQQQRQRSEDQSLDATERLFEK